MDNNINNIMSSSISQTKKAAKANASNQSKSSDDKMTPAMKASLDNLRCSLLCGVCNQLMKEASTLGCAHSFCYDCISKYTENKWNCPFPSCNISVTSMKGSSDSYIKKNPQINDVVIALQRLEENVRAAPANWWGEGDNHDVDEDNVDGNNAEEEEIVDFAAMMDQSDECQQIVNSYHSDDDDESSATEPYELGRETSGENKRMNKISIEQSLFLSDQTSDANKAEKESILPRFSGVSTIAWQHSQATETPDSIKKTSGSIKNNTASCNDEPQTATASQLDRMLILSDQRVETMRSGSKHTPNQSKKKRKNSNNPSNEDIEKTKPKTRRTHRVSFQPQPKIMLLAPSSALKNTDSRSIRKCIKDDMISILKMPRDDVIDDDNLDTGFDFDKKLDRELFLTLLSSQRDDHSTPVPSSHYALSTEKEYAFEDGVVVPRSFQFYLAVACGLSIVDISFLESQLKKKRLGIMNHQRYPFPSTDEKSITIDEKATRVIGASNHNWFAPQKAHSVAIERHSLWTREEGIHASSDTLLPGTDLLQNYSVILVGDFDQPSASNRVTKRKARSVKGNSDGFRTKGNITMLLQLCGAKVYDVTSMTGAKKIKKGLSKTQATEIAVTSPLGHSEGSSTLKVTLDSCVDSKVGHDGEVVVVMVKDKSDLELGTDFITQFKSFTSDSIESGSVDIVSCDWLFDCIGDFQVHKSG